MLMTPGSTSRQGTRSSQGALHAHVRENIRSNVLSGRYAPGSRIPTESEMIATFGVSKVTIRRAIQDLACEGVLVGHRGKGIFVNDGKFASSATLLFIHASDTPAQNSYIQLLMSGILSENKITAPFRLELIARPQTEQQTDDDDTVEQLVNCARINGIVTLPRVREAQMKRLSNMGIPVAVIAHTDYPLPPGVISVDTGPTSAIECQAMHAREIGAKRVGIITDQLMVAPTNLALVHEAMRKFKVPIIPDAFERAEFGTNDARAATLRLLKHFPDLDTLLAIDDLTAMGCLHACYQLGLKVPEQIRIIGIGNMFGEHSHCGLTTVDSHIGRQGQLAARAIMRCLAGERIEPRTLIEPTLLRRETTRLQF